MRLSNQQIDAVVDILCQKQKEKDAAYRVQQKKKFLENASIQSTIAGIVKDAKILDKKLTKLFRKKRFFTGYSDGILLDKKRLTQYLFEEQHHDLTAMSTSELRNTVVLAAMDSADLAELGKRLGVKL